MVQTKFLFLMKCDACWDLNVHHNLLEKLPWYQTLLQDKPLDEDEGDDMRTWPDSSRTVMFGLQYLRQSDPWLRPSSKTLWKVTRAHERTVTCERTNRTRRNAWRLCRRFLSRRRCIKTQKCPGFPVTPLLRHIIMHRKLPDACVYVCVFVCVCVSI